MQLRFRRRRRGREPVLRPGVGKKIARFFLPIIFIAPVFIVPVLRGQIFVGYVAQNAGKMFEGNAEAGGGAAFV